MRGLLSWSQYCGKGRWWGKGKWKKRLPRRQIRAPAPWHLDRGSRDGSSHPGDQDSRLLGLTAPSLLPGKHLWSL